MKKIVKYINPEIKEYRGKIIQRDILEFKSPEISPSNLQLIIWAIKKKAELDKQQILQIELNELGKGTILTSYKLEWLLYPGEKGTITTTEAQKFIQTPPKYTQVAIGTPVILGLNMPLILGILKASPKFLFAITAVLMAIGYSITSLRTQKEKLGGILAIPQLFLIFGSLFMGLFLIRELKKGF